MQHAWASHSTWHNRIASSICTARSCARCSSRNARSTSSCTRRACSSSCREIYKVSLWLIHTWVIDHVTIARQPWHGLWLFVNLQSQSMTHSKSVYDSLKVSLWLTQSQSMTHSKSVYDSLKVILWLTQSQSMTHSKSVYDWLCRFTKTHRPCHHCKAAIDKNQLMSAMTYCSCPSRELLKVSP